MSSGSDYPPLLLRQNRRLCLPGLGRLQPAVHLARAPVVRQNPIRPRIVDVRGPFWQDFRAMPDLALALASPIPWGGGMRMSSIMR